MQAGGRSQIERGSETKKCRKTDFSLAALDPAHLHRSQARLVSEVFESNLVRYPFTNKRFHNGDCGIYVRTRYGSRLIWIG